MALIFNNLEKESNFYKFYNTVFNNVNNISQGSTFKRAGNIEYKLSQNNKDIGEDIDIDLVPYDDYINDNEDDIFQRYYAGASKEFVTNILNMIYYKPFFRSFTKGTLKPIVPTTKSVVLSTIVDLNSIIPDGDFKNIEKNIKDKKWNALFTKDSYAVFDPAKTNKKQFFKSTSKLVVLTFKVDKKVEFYEEVDYNKENESQEFKSNQAVLMKVKGTSVMIIDNKNLKLDKIYKFNDDNSIKTIKSLKDLGEFRVRNKDEISSMLKETIELSTNFKPK